MKNSRFLHPIILLRNFVFLVLPVAISLPALAQNTVFANLFFTPVPLAQSDLITLNSAALSDNDKRSAEQAVTRFNNEISVMESENPDNPELITQLNSLGLVLQALDQHEEALAVYEKSAALAVELYGENSLQQAPMLEQAILSHLKLNNISKITENEEFLYQLRSTQYAPDSAEMYSAMTNLANWYSSAYFKEGYLAQNPGFIPRIASTQRVRRQTGIGNATTSDDTSFGSASAGRGDLLTAIASGDVRDVTINDVIDIRLRKLDDLYKRYQESYSSNTTLSMVVDVARRIARLSYHAEQEMDYERAVQNFDPNYTGSREEAIRNSDQRRDESYDVGKAALVYVLDLVQSAEGVGAQQVTIALLDLADWELAYGKAAAAKERYQEAYQVLIDEGYDNPTIDAALTAAVPIQIPRIGAFPATQQTSGSLGLIQNPNYTGYIDVSFSLDELGNASAISILDSSDTNTARIQAILETQLQISKFRPLIRGGETLATGQVELRYYFTL
tara:strand:+ start:2308 stop:3822 length:1515 start_codon:yes stop_codon:yes gene_type:complete